MPAGLTAMQAVAAARRLPPRPQRHNTECIGPREGSGGPPMSRSSILGMGRELCQAAAAAGGTQRPEMATPWRQRRAAELLWQLQAAARVRAAQHVTAVACLTRRQRGRLTRRACKRNGSQDPRRAGGLRGVIRNPSNLRTIDRNTGGREASWANPSSWRRRRRRRACIHEWRWLQIKSSTGQASDASTRTDGYQVAAFAGPLMTLQWARKAPSGTGPEHKGQAVGGQARRLS